MSTRWFLIAGSLAACNAPPEAAPGPSAQPTPTASPAVVALEVPPLPRATPIPVAREGLYRSALPTAARFEPVPIPREMLLSEDKGNDSYVRALDGRGKLVGYLREFSGPIIPGRSENPYPIAVLLVLAPNLTLMDLVPTSPLLKGENLALSAAELEHIRSLAKAPPAALAAIPRSSDVVDATTEATRPALRDAVVPGAAYTSHRIVGLVARTRELIGRVPGIWDRKRIKQLTPTPVPEAALAGGLAGLLPTLFTEDSRVAVYRTMASSYATGLRSGNPPNRAVEAMLLNPPLPPEIANTEIARGCYALARHHQRSQVVTACVTRVTSASPHAGDENLVARLVGTHRMNLGDAAGALGPLRRAAKAFEMTLHPELHLNLVQAALAAGQGGRHCDRAKSLFRDHPLLPGAREALAACPNDDTAALVASLRQSQRDSLLRSRRQGTAPAPVLSLETDQFTTVEIQPTGSKVISVWVFFSTWCPHCAVELPRVNDFARMAKARSDLSDRVRVVGVRTAIEKERIPYDQFLAQLQPEFPIYADPALSLVFGNFCRTQDIAPELPTLAVLDSEGAVRFLLASGPYRDTSQELTWAVEALLQ